MVLHSQGSSAEDPLETTLTSQAHGIMLGLSENQPLPERRACCLVFRTLSSRVAEYASAYRFWMSIEFPQATELQKKCMPAFALR